MISFMQHHTCCACFRFRYCTSSPRSLHATSFLSFCVKHKPSLCRWNLMLTCLSSACPSSQSEGSSGLMSNSASSSWRRASLHAASSVLRSELSRLLRPFRDSTFFFFFFSSISFSATRRNNRMFSRDSLSSSLRSLISTAGSSFFGYNSMYSSRWRLNCR